MYWDIGWEYWNGYEWKTVYITDDTTKTNRMQIMHAVYLSYANILVVAGISAIC